MGSSASNMSPVQLNALQRQAVNQKAVTVTQPIYSQTIFPPSNAQITVPVKPVGLIKKFIIEIVGTLNNTSGTVAALTDFGLSNLLSQVTFTDLNNNTRVNTTGAHLTMLAAVKRRQPFLATYDTNQILGNNRSQLLNVPPASWGVLQGPSTIAAGATATVRAVFELPLAYTDHGSQSDLRGAVYAGVVNATMNIGLTFNTNVFVGAAPADFTNAVYSNGGGTFTQATVTVSQVYLDQLPQGQSGVILPTLDLATVYELKNTTVTGITPNNEYPIPFANFRDFASVFCIFNNNGTATGRNFGTDVNYLALQSASFTNLWKVSPFLHQQWSREITGADNPAGVYYSSFRDRPISTQQFGNMELIINPSVATANASVQVYWEDLAISNTLTSGGSLV